MDSAEPRARHQQHAAEADHDGAKPARADAFAQDGHCKQRHDQRRHEGDGRRLGQLQVAHGEEVQQRGAEQEAGAHDLQHRLRRARDARLCPGIEHRQDHQHVRAIARPHDLRGRQVPRQPFRRCVQPREQQHGPAHQHDADKALPARIPCRRFLARRFRRFWRCLFHALSGALPTLAAPGHLNHAASACATPTRRGTPAFARCETARGVAVRLAQA